MLIGISGFKGSGKDTIAAALQKEFNDLNISTGSIAFARGIKEALIKQFNIDSVYFHDQTLKETPIPGLIINGKPYSARELMTDYHDAMVPVFGENIFVDSTFDFITKHSDVQNWILTDTRYVREAKRISDLGGVIVKVLRDGALPSEHSSEQGLPDEYIDIVFENRYVDFSYVEQREDFQKRISSLALDILKLHSVKSNFV